MNFYTRFGNGWTIAMNSLKVLRANRKLIIFPILSSISMLLIIASFLTFLLGLAGWDPSIFEEKSKLASYSFIFGFYIINYFVVIFFNMALIHCTSLYFKGEEVSVREGIRFSITRIRKILVWALISGTVGGVLRIIQENVGILGRIITALVGVVWSIATFFVIPVLAYENLGPLDAFKRSSQLMKERWGESIGARFSMNVMYLFGLIIIAIIAGTIGAAINLYAGIIIAVIAILVLHTITSAAKIIFVSQVYHNVMGEPIQNYNQEFMDNLFAPKK